MRQVEKERQQRKQKMSQLLARVKHKPAASTAASHPTTFSQPTAATTPSTASAASSPTSPRRPVKAGKRHDVHARSSSAGMAATKGFGASTADQSAESVSLPSPATSTFVLAMQKRDEEIIQRKQAAALRRKQKENEAKAQLQRRQLEQQQRKQDEAKSLATKQHEEQNKQRAIDDEKQRQRELQREKTALARMHHSYALMRWTGWDGWRRYVRARQASEQAVAELGEQKRVRRLWRLWRSRVEQRKEEEAREDERKMTKAANHHQRQLQAVAFKPWQRLTLHHTQSVCQGDGHYQRSLQRAACLLWACGMRAAVAANEERLLVLEVRAVAMGERHLLRFWLVKWKHAHSLTREEKQMSVHRVALSHSQRACVPQQHILTSSSRFRVSVCVASGCVCVCVP